jgi:hypothetical protein
MNEFKKNSFRDNIIGDIGSGATFIAGSPRSGTTLMTALLDGHPELLVFPEEYLYVQPRKIPAKGNRHVLASLFKEKVLLRLKGEKSFLDELHTEQRKYDDLDYHRFEDEVHKCFRILSEKENKTDGMSMATLAFISLIYGYRIAIGKERYSRWVVKHPNYEFHWQRLLNDFPEAKVIYMIRDPREVILSRTLKRNKKRFLKRGGNVAIWKSENSSFRPSVRFLKEWERSVMESIRISEIVSGQILRVRYEDLVAAPRDIMRKVSEFMGVPWQESLVIPSFLGMLWKGDSMQERTFQGIGSSERRKKYKFPSHHLWQIEAWLGDVMIKEPGEYVRSELLERLDMKGLLSRLRGEGFTDFLRNRRRMLSNQRNRT